jgi:hypothetical protein
MAWDKIIHRSEIEAINKCKYDDDVNLHTC